MSRIKYIFFDCMETIIDLYELPTSSDYAFWAYANSGTERYWDSFMEFLNNYEDAKKNISSKIGNYEEYDLVKRMEVIVKRNERIPHDLKSYCIDRLYNTFWDTYKSKCYIERDVEKTLNKLSNNYKLAVISNFKVINGIEELLEIHKVKHLFEFIISSVNFGWRKPDIRIYQHALNLSKCEPNEVVFIGDDYENDYIAPTKMGIKSLLLIKNNSVAVRDNISSFLDIEVKLAGF